MKRNYFLIILVLFVGLFLVGCFKEDKKVDEPKEEQEEKVEAPVDNTEELKEKMEVIEASKVTEDEIVFLKEVVVKTEVKYETETKKDNNKKKGSKEVTQKGVNGEIATTYKVTYDENGKEISREKVSEKVTKKAIKEIVVVGAAEYNINTSKITSEFIGFMCSESQTMTYDGQKVCDDSVQLPSFKIIAIDKGSYKVVTVNEVAITPITVTKKGNLYVGTCKGKTHYFEVRGGGGNPEGEPLTMNLCKKYNLSCGVW